MQKRSNCLNNLVILSLFLILLIPGNLRAQAPPEAVKARMQRLLEAAEQRDRELFLKDSIPEFQEAITPEVFEQVCGILSKPLQKGYDLSYFGDMVKQGHTVHLWRLRFKEANDDVVAHLIMMGDETAGFWLE